MRSRRDRFGPAVACLAVAVMLACSLFGAPGAHAEELDTGPVLELVTEGELLLVTYPPELLPVLAVGTVTQALEGLNVYFAELRAEIPSARDTAEHARNESGRTRSGVGKRGPTIARYDVDMRPDEGTTAHPLRC